MTILLEIPKFHPPESDDLARIWQRTEVWNVDMLLCMNAACPKLINKP